MSGEKMSGTTPELKDNSQSVRKPFVPKPFVPKPFEPKPFKPKPHMTKPISVSEPHIAKPISVSDTPSTKSSEAEHPPPASKSRLSRRAEQIQFAYDEESRKRIIELKLILLKPQGVRFTQMDDTSLLECLLDNLMSNKRLQNETHKALQLAPSEKSDEEMQILHDKIEFIKELITLLILDPKKKNIVLLRIQILKSDVLEHTVPENKLYKRLYEEYIKLKFTNRDSVEFDIKKYENIKYLMSLVLLLPK